MGVFKGDTRSLDHSSHGLRLARWALASRLESWTCCTDSMGPSAQ